jgi:hypothetical protein
MIDALDLLSVQELQLFDDCIAFTECVVWPYIHPQPRETI